MVEYCWVSHLQGTGGPTENSLAMGTGHFRFFGTIEKRFIGSSHKKHDCSFMRSAPNKIASDLRFLVWGSMENTRWIVTHKNLEDTLFVLLTVCELENGPVEIVDFHQSNMVIFRSYVKLPEGNFPIQKHSIFVPLDPLVIKQLATETPRCQRVGNGQRLQIFRNKTNVTRRWCIHKWGGHPKFRRSTRSTSKVGLDRRPFSL